jgi:hypothetical protein
MMHRRGSKDGPGAGANTSFVLHEPEVGETAAAHARARRDQVSCCVVTDTVLGAHVPASSVAPLTLKDRVHWGDAVHDSTRRGTGSAQGIPHPRSEYAIKFGGVHELP